MRTLQGRRLRAAIGALFAAAMVLSGVVSASANPLGEVTIFKTGLRSTAVVTNLTAGPEGNVWFVDNTAPSGIGRITPEGAITEYISGTNLSGLTLTESNLTGIAVGPEKKLWVTAYGVNPGIAVIDPASPESATEFLFESGSKPLGIVAGTDGNLWFADAGSTPMIGAFSPTENKIVKKCTGLNAGSQPHGIVMGSDGNLWFTDTGTTRAIGKVNPSTCAIEEFETGVNSEPGGSGSEVGPWGIAAGPDGNVWFTDNGSNEVTGKAICKIAPAGTITCFKTGLVATSSPHGITAAADGKLWFTDDSGVTEQQKLTFSGAVNEEEFKVCGEPKPAETICKTFKYRTVTTTGTRTELRNRIKAALEGIFGAGALSVTSTATTTTCGGNCSVPINFEETGPYVDTDVPQVTCSPVVGSGVCTPTTVTNGVANAVGSITTSGTITRYPIAGLFSAIGITYSEGNVWSSAGIQTVAKIVRLGIEPSLTLKVKCGGYGSGTVSPVECGSSTEKESGKVVELTATAAEGSEFTGWTKTAGTCTGTTNPCKVTISGFNNIEVEAKFDKKEPTNLGTLSVSKSGAGQGAVSSKPKGIKCGNTCPTAEAKIYKEQKVVLVAKAALTSGSKFEGWTGCDSETKSEAEGTCTIEKMSKVEEVVAKFGGTPKAILNAKTLTLTKGAVTAKGAVKATGLSCEEACSQTKVQYTGGDGGKKLPATVTLTQVPMASSTFTGWEGCDSEKEGACVVVMSSDKSVTANYALRPVETLTLGKEGSGQGAVASKPKGIKCGNTCPTATMEVPQEQKVILVAKAAVTAGSTFEGWSAGCESETKSGTEGTCTVKVESATTIKAKFGGTAKAILNPKVLTVTKAGKALGTVKASGLACEPACTTTQVEYTSGDGGKKLPAMVTLEAISAPGAKTVVWSGCDSEKEGKCVVTMSSAKSVTATFDELP